MHAVRPGLVRRRADHAPLGRVTVAAHHYRPSAQFGMAQHLDRRDELVKVHVQHPPPHALLLPDRAPGTVMSMSWSKYAEFLAFAAVLVVIPGADFAVVTKNTLIGGHRRGSWTALGVSSSNLVKGSAAAAGLSALIVRVQPLFEAIKWAGVAYLAYLGVQALRSARRGEYAPLDDDAQKTGQKTAPKTAQNVAGWRQGFLSNIT